MYTANDLSKVKLIKDEPNNYKSRDVNTTTAKEEVPSVSFIKLFRFASTMDKLYIYLAIIFSVICGAMTPINTLLFSSLLQSMVNYGKSAANNKPQPEIFLDDVKEFAINNSVIGVIVVVLSYAATVLMNISAFNQVYRIKQEYLKSALNQDFEYFDTHQTGDFASKISEDIVKLEDGIGEKLATFIFCQTSFISSIIMAFAKGWKLSILCLFLFPVPLFLIGIAASVAFRLSKQEADTLDKAGSIAEEVISAIRTAVAFGGHRKEIERYEKYVTEARRININTGLFKGITMGILLVCLFGAYAFSVWFGFKLMVDEPDVYDVNTVIAVVLGVLIGSSNFGMSLTLIEVFGFVRGAGAQILNLINTIPLINLLLNSGITPETIEGNIELKNVFFQYQSGPDIPVATDDPKLSFVQVVRLNAPEWKSIAVASICSLVSGSAMPLLAVTVGDLIGILSNPDVNVVTTQVLRYSLIILGVGLLSGFTNFFMVYLFDVANANRTTRLQKRLFEQMIQQEVGFNDDKSNSTRALCAQLLGEIASVQGTTGQRLGTVLQAVGTFIFAVGVSLYYESRLGWVAIAFIPFMAAVLYKQDRIIKKDRFGTAQTVETMSKIGVEAEVNIHTVASLGQKQSFLNGYATQLLSTLEVAKRSSHYRGIVFGLSRGLFSFMYAVIFYYAGYLMVYERVGYDLILSSAQVLFLGSLSVAQAFAVASDFRKRIKAAGRLFLIGRESKIIDPLQTAVENFAQDGTPLPSLHLVDVRQSIDIVQQQPILSERTIGENIAYDDNLRKGYETNLGSTGTPLSKGQKQRIAIARALIRPPKMVLFDEANSLYTESEKTYFINEHNSKNTMP